MINGNPNYKDVENLAMDFLAMSLSQGEKQSVNMNTMIVGREKNFCGTPACHAGWYLSYSIGSDVDHGFYDEGVRKIIQRLKFNSDSDLTEWAAANPKIWGNRFGVSMFLSIRAFHDRQPGKLTLKDLSNHWLGVAKRLYKIQTV